MEMQCESTLVTLGLVGASGTAVGKTIEIVVSHLPLNIHTNKNIFNLLKILCLHMMPFAFLFTLISMKDVYLPYLNAN